MSQAASPTPSPRSSVSYWSVVATQLGKNRIAMGAGRTVLALLVLAIGAPLIAMNIPLTASVDGSLSMPLLETLFDRFIYPGGVDVFFNLLLVVGTFWFVAARIPDRLRVVQEGKGLDLFRSPLWQADAAAVGASAALLLLSLGDGVGGTAGSVLRGLCWVALVPALPWTGPFARLIAGALLLAAGPAFVGWILLGLAFPTLTGVLVLVYLFLGALLGAGTVLVLLLAFGLPGAVLWAWASRRKDERPGDLRRSRRLRIARFASSVLFVIAFVLLMGPFRATHPLVDWQARLDAAAAPGDERDETIASLEARMEAPGISAPQRAQLAADLAFAAGRASATLPPIPYHPNNVGETGLAPIERSLKKPDRLNVLGCDLNGRDISARLLYGARISLTIGLVAVSIYVTIGIILGSLAGYYGGWVDIVISRLIEIMICFPVLFLLLTIIAVFETRSIFLIMAGIGIVGWPGVSRLVRGEFLRQRNLDYVTAAQAQGLPEWRVIFGHVLPNSLGPVLVSATFGIAAAILVESALAFLGLGDTTAPSWGQILTNGRAQGQWHMILAPGFAIFFVVTMFNLLGEGLRDALDPKLRR